MPRSQKTTKQGTTVFLYFFSPSTFFHFLILKSQTATGLNMTDNCCTLSTYSYFQGVFGVTKTWLSVATAVHFQVFLDFNSIPVGQVPFTIATLTAHRSQEATAAETESSSHIRIRTGAPTLGRSNMWLLTVNWEKLSPYQSYVSSWAWIHPQINPVPSSTRAALKPGKIRKLKIEFSLLILGHPQHNLQAFWSS